LVPYELQPGFNLVIIRDGDRLISQATGQQAVEIYPASATRYFLKVIPAEVDSYPAMMAVPRS
jgi:hypothetical protein